MVYCFFLSFQYERNEKKARNTESSHLQQLDTSYHQTRDAVQWLLLFHRKYFLLEVAAPLEPEEGNVLLVFFPFIPVLRF